jgi:hypothetical protein
MPLVVVEAGSVPVGRTFNAVLCDATVFGNPIVGPMCRYKSR